MSLFYRNPRVSGLLVLFVLLFGLVALGGLARQEDPTMTERYASVSTFLPGATANRVESLISEPLETGLREIPEIRVMGSKSRAGYSLLDIELYDHVGPGETDTVWSEIRDKLVRGGLLDKLSEQLTAASRPHASAGAGRHLPPLLLDLTAPSTPSSRVRRPSNELSGGESHSDRPRCPHRTHESPMASR